MLFIQATATCRAKQGKRGWLLSQVAGCVSLSKAKSVWGISLARQICDDRLLHAPAIDEPGESQVIVGSKRFNGRFVDDGYDDMYKSSCV